MRTGSLSKRVKVIQINRVLDGAGGSTPSETEILETWASIIPVRGQRGFQYNKIIQATWFDVVLRYREDINITKDLILDYNGKELILHSVINKDERRKVIEVVAYERD
jgi:SPP1 family predicted phage head-tail adaptor